MLSTIKHKKLGIAVLVLQLILTETVAVMPDAPHEVIINVMSERSKHILKNANEEQLRDLLPSFEYGSPAYSAIIERIKELKR